MRDIIDLREHLFDVIEKVKSGDMDVKQAKAVSEAAQTMINSAKIEVEYMDKIGSRGTGFIEHQQQKPRLVK